MIINKKKIIMISAITISAFWLMSLLGGVSVAQSSGIITTVAGNGTAGFSGDGSPAISAQIGYTTGIAVDSAGNLYIADGANHRVRKVTRDGMISTVAGNGTPGYSGDGGLATAAQLYNPEDVAVDSSGNLYITDWFPKIEGVVRKVTPDGIINSVCRYLNPFRIAVDAEGNLYVADDSVWFGHVIHKFTPSGESMDLVGGRQAYPVNGDPAISIGEISVSDIAVDSNGNLYVAAEGWDPEWDNRILRISANGIISIIAGGGTGLPRDGTYATAVKIYSTGIEVDAQGNIYLADQGVDGTRPFIFKITADGVMHLIAGNGTKGYGGDGGPAISAQLSDPYGVALDSLGNLYISDSGNARIREVIVNPAVTYFPLIPVGGGWSTVFSIINIGLAETSGKLIILDSQGNPLEVNGELTDSFGTAHPSQQASSFDFSIPPGGSVHLSAAVREGVWAGWARLESMGNSLSAMATCEYVNGEKTESLLAVSQSQPLQLAVVPVDMDTGTDKQLAYTIMNPNNRAISVSLKLVGLDGIVVNNSTLINLGPGAQISRYLTQDLALTKFEGTLVISGLNGQTFVASVLLAKQGIFATLPLIKF